MTAPLVVEARSWRWHLERAAAVLLIVLLPVHLLSLVVVGDPAGWSAARLAARWATPGARALDWVTLSLALVHGLGAARRRCPDSAAGRVARVAADASLLVGLLGVAIVALTYRIV